MAVDLAAIEATLNKAFPGAVVDRDGEWLVLDPGQLEAVAIHLRDEMGFDYLTNLSASDYPDRIEVVYNIYSTRPDLQGPGVTLVGSIISFDPANTIEFIQLTGSGIFVITAADTVRLNSIYTIPGSYTVANNNCNITKIG